MEWLPVAAAGICILISIPLSKLLKIKYVYLSLAAVLAFIATFIFPSFFDQSRSLQDVMEKTLVLGGGLVVLFCAVAVIAMWLYEKRKKKKQGADGTASLATQSTRTPSRYAKLREEVLNKKPNTDEDLLFAAYLKEQRMAEAMELAEKEAAFVLLEAEPPATSDISIEADGETDTDVAPEAIQAEEPQVCAALEAAEQAEPDAVLEAAEEVTFYIAPESIEEAERSVMREIPEEESCTEKILISSGEIFDEKEPLAYAETPIIEPDIIVTEAQGELLVSVDTEKDLLSEMPDLMTILDSAYTAMSSADWEHALMHFGQALMVTQDPYTIQRIKLELLNMLMRLDRRREASDLVFDILGAGYKLNNAETTTLFNVLQELEKGVE